MTRIWLVRHFPIVTAKCYRSKFGCDPDIGDFVKNLSLLISLTLKCGNLDKIISSPYLRCRRTAEYIKQFLIHDNEVEIDNVLGEFLSRGSSTSFDQHLSLRVSTRELNPILYFDSRKYEEVVREFLSQCRERFNGMSNVLVVTHSFFLTCIINLLQYSRVSTGRPSCICLSVTEDNITVEEFDLLK